jgi:hypothetical protein
MGASTKPGGEIKVEKLTPEIHKKAKQTLSTFPEKFLLLSFISKIPVNEFKEANSKKRKREDDFNWKSVLLREQDSLLSDIDDLLLSLNLLELQHNEKVECITARRGTFSRVFG